MKKIIASILSLVMCLTMNFVVHAEGQEGIQTTSDTGETQTYNFSEAFVLDGAGGHIEKNGVVVLDKDYSYNWIVASAGYNITLDLNGHTLTIKDENDGFYCYGNLTIKDSTVKNSPTVEGNVVSYSSGKIIGDVIATENASIKLESGTIETKKLGLLAEGDTKPNGEAVNSTITINDGYIVNNAYFAAYVVGNGGTLNINGGVLKATDNAVVGGNGTKNTDIDEGGTTINISGGTFIGGITDESYSKGYIACGVYHPQNGNLNITGGTFNIEKGVGILTRSGSTSITNANITVSDSQIGYVGDSKIKVPSVAVYNDTVANYPGGTPSTKVSGGTYSTDVSEYLAEGYKVAKIGTTYQVMSNDTTEVKVDENTAAVSKEVTENITEFKDKAEGFDESKIETVDVKVKDTTLTDDQKTSVESTLKSASALADNETISTVLPLDITLQATDSNNKTATITGYKDNITVTVLLTDDAVKSLTGKYLKVVRIHDEKYDVVSSNAQLVGNSLTFTSNKFSTYVIVASTKSYKVTYKVTGDSKYGLPTTVVGAIPNQTEYAEGATVTVVDALTTTDTKSSDGTNGTWTFSWDKGNFDITEDTTITGKWVFTADNTPTAKPSASPTPTTKPSASPTPTAKPTPTVKPTATPQSTTKPSATSTPESTVEPMATPSATVAPTAKAESKSVDTSDSSNVMFYSGLLIIAIGGLIGMVVLKKKHQA